MNIAIEGCILAIVALRESKDNITTAVPIFWADSPKQAEHTCLLLSRVLKAMSHDLENGTYIIVRH